jgi:hypothetical protein
MEPVYVISSVSFQTIYGPFKVGEAEEFLTKRGHRHVGSDGISQVWEKWGRTVHVTQLTAPASWEV